MGNSPILPTPLTSKAVHRVETPYLNAACVSMQGWRKAMEDSHMMYATPSTPSTAATTAREITPPLPPSSTITTSPRSHSPHPRRSTHSSSSSNCISDSTPSILFGVFDGHSGDACSKYCSTKLPELLNSLAAKSGHRLTSKEELTQAVLQLDENFFRGNEKDSSGTTATFLVGTPVVASDNTHQDDLQRWTLHAVNVGDSRIILGRQGTHAIPLTHDHKPDLPTESSRIDAAGGFVQNNRVNGELALSRAIGDRVYKRCMTSTTSSPTTTTTTTTTTATSTSRSIPTLQIPTRTSLSVEALHELYSKPQTPTLLVVPHPEIITHECTSADFVFLGCDGFFEPDTMTNQEIVNIIASQLQVHRGDLGKALIGLGCEALHRGSTDNMTGMLLKFKPKSQISCSEVATSAATAGVGGGYLPCQAKVEFLPGHYQHITRVFHDAYFAFAKEEAGLTPVQVMETRYEHIRSRLAELTQCGSSNILADDIPSPSEEHTKSLLASGNTSTTITNTSSYPPVATMPAFSNMTMSELRAWKMKYGLNAFSSGPSPTDEDPSATDADGALSIGEKGSLTTTEILSKGLDSPTAAATASPSLSRTRSPSGLRASSGRGTRQRLELECQNRWLEIAGWDDNVEATLFQELDLYGSSPPLPPATKAEKKKGKHGNATSHSSSSKRGKWFEKKIKEWEDQFTTQLYDATQGLDGIEDEIDAEELVEELGLPPGTSLDEVDWDTLQTLLGTNDSLQGLEFGEGVEDDDDDDEEAEYPSEEDEEEEELNENIAAVLSGKKGRIGRGGSSSSAKQPQKQQKLKRKGNKSKPQKQTKKNNPKLGVAVGPQKKKRVLDEAEAEAEAEGLGELPRPLPSPSKAHQRSGGSSSSSNSGNPPLKSPSRGQSLAKSPVSSPSKKMKKHE